MKNLRFLFFCMFITSPIVAMEDNALTLSQNYFSQENSSLVPNDLWKRILIEEYLLTSYKPEEAAIRLKYAREVCKSLRDFFDNAKNIKQLVPLFMNRYNFKTHCSCVSYFKTASFNTYAKINQDYRNSICWKPYRFLRTATKDEFFDPHFTSDDRIVPVVSLIKEIKSDKKLSDPYYKRGGFFKKFIRKNVRDINALYTCRTCVYDKSYNCSLFEASLSKTNAAAERLIELKANVDQKNEFNKTPLEEAINYYPEKSYKSRTIVTFLLKNKADINQSPAALNIVNNPKYVPLQSLLKKYRSQN